MPKKVLVPILTGFEEMEAVIIIDVLRRGKVEVVTVSDTKEPILASRNTRHLADRIFSEINPNEFDAIVLPGGVIGTKNLMESKETRSFLKHFNKKDQMIAAICAAPNVLRKEGIIHSEIPFAAFPTSLDLAKGFGGRYVVDRIVSHNNIHTSIGPGSAFEFALFLLEKLTDTQTMSEVKAGLHLPN